MKVFKTKLHSAEHVSCNKGESFPSPLAHYASL